MNYEIIISTLSIVISVFSLLFFSCFPCIKKTLINKTFKKIENFYYIYRHLNPCYYGKYDELTENLRTQNFLSKAFPRFEFIIDKNTYAFDPFQLQESFWSTRLTFFEILYFYNFWNISLKKLNYIKKIINEYEFIMSEKNFDNIEWIDYKDNGFICNNIKSSISLCPNFDNLKLYGSISSNCCEYKQEKLDLSKINKFVSDKKFLKELKSKSFCINLSFESDKFVNNFQKYSYSIKFSNNCITYLEAFFHNRYIDISQLCIDEIIKQLNYIKTTFRIDLNKINFDKPDWLNKKL